MRDWFDDYLDGINQYKIVQVPPDSHIGKKKPELNILQKKMLFDAAAITEAEMRLINERRAAEQAELDAHSGGDDGSAATKEGPLTPPTPPTPPGPGPYDLAYLGEQIAYNGENLTYGA
jgi:hypothetical protein